MRTLFTLKPCAALFVIVVCSQAFAADTNQLHAFAPPPGDTSVDMLTKIFGPVIDGLKAGQAAGSGNGQTVIGAMMGTFNSAVLFLAMLFVLYTTVRGTIDTAHSGELLGKKMSEIWVPLRTVGGTALLLPLASGFSLLQMAVLWLALQGAGVASSVWDVAMNHLTANGNLGYVSLPDARPLAANILRSEICMLVMNKQYEESGFQTRIEFAATSIPVVFSSTPDQQYMTESYIDKAYAWRASNRIFNPNVCGSISFQDTPQSKDLSSSLRGPLLAAHSQAVRAMIDELRPVTAKIAAFQTPAAGAIDLAVTHYKTTLQAAANHAIAAMPDVAKSDFVTYARDAGWVAAGAWWSSITRLNDAVQSAVNALPVSQASSIEELETKSTLIAYQDAMTFTEQYLKDRAGAPRAEATADIKIRSADDVWRLLSVPAMAGIDTLTQRIAGANTSPVTQLRSIGNDIVSIGVAVKSAVFVAAGLLGGKDVEWTVGLGFNVLEAFKTLSGTAEWLSSALFIIGATLAYYLPAVPVIWWVMGVLRWLVSVAEAVLAAPVMAAMMIHPDSHDVVGKSGPGFMLILAMVLQPALLLFALVLAILMTYPGAALVNQLFLQMVSGTVGNTGVGLVGLVAFIALYLTMMVLVMHSCFALVSAVPDNVMRYFAAQAGAYGVVKTGDEAYSNLHGGAAGAGAGVVRGGVGLNSVQMRTESGVRESKSGSVGSASESAANGFANADHLGK